MTGVRCELVHFDGPFIYVYPSTRKNILLENHYNYLLVH
jgi:hypothetical protein